MTDETIDLQALFDALPTGLGSVPLSELAEPHRATLKTLGEYDPLRLATSFAGLLTIPELQSNCIRVEALIHVAMAYAKGKRKPSDQFIAKMFSEFGEGPIGWKEDPSEDVFVSLVRTPRGNFRVLEGTWESAGFHLQRVMDALHRIPAQPRYDYLRECVYALLGLSELVCERAKLHRYQLGNENPESHLHSKFTESLSKYRRVVRFTEADLAARGIAIDELAEFGFVPSRRGELAHDTIGHSELERFPVAYRNGEFFLLLPTAVSVAIRRFIMEKMEELNLRQVFAQTLAYEYAQFFSSTPLLGSESGAPIEFKFHEGVLPAGAMMKADKGLYLSFVFFADTLENFREHGLMGVYPHDDGTRLHENIEKWIDHAYDAASKEPDFRECVTVLVGCGIGRAIAVRNEFKPRAKWRNVFLSAPDLLTISWLEDFKPLSLWRLMDSREKLESMNVMLQNINGLLNVVAWARSLGGHLVPHGDVPSDFGGDDRPMFIMVEQNALRNVRHEMVAHWDPHAAYDVEGKWHNIRRDARALFEEDSNRPFYITERDEDSGRWPRGVYETPSRWWWFDLVTTEETTGRSAYMRYQMLKTWLCRIAPVLDEHIPGLPTGPLLWRLNFKGTFGDFEGQKKREFATYEQAIAALSFTLPDNGREVVIDAAPDYELTFFNPENIAERALVRCTVEAFARLAKADLSPERMAELVQMIVQNASARQSHAFIARNFRDYVHESFWRKPFEIDTDDAAFQKLGLGWRHRSRSEGANIEGRENCTAYLNTLVRDIEDEVCADLRQLDRRSVIMFALNNHESAIFDRDNWRRTASAVLALHSDKEATLAVMSRHDMELNAIFHASRLIVEFAICECPIKGGRIPGKLDMSRLMAKLLTISSFGGWSAAIHWEAMEPRLLVTPLGDVHANVAFQNEILEPYARAGNDLTVQDAVEKYPKNLEDRVPKPTETSLFDAEFWEAAEEQFGAPFDTLRKFIDELEDIGLKRELGIFAIKKSELLAVTQAIGDVDAGDIVRLLDFLMFASRPHWRDVPAGFDDRDRFPWRFRRRLSILRRPLIQMDDEEDPTIIVAPGIVRDAFVYMVGNYQRGDFPVWQLSPKMRAWSGRSRDRIGHEFNQEVAKRMRELGWQAEADVPVTKIFGKGSLDGFGDLKAYGDVDVLAWRDDSPRVLLMECKDVQHRKIEGEIAEQLADFRGELRPNGKPDMLLRHLNRMSLISAHPKELAAYLKKTTEPMIEAHLVFKNPVPMKFALKRMEARIATHLLSGLDQI